MIVALEKAEVKRPRLVLGRYDRRNTGEELKEISGRTGPGVQHSVEEHALDQQWGATVSASTATQIANSHENTARQVKNQHA